MSSSRLPYTTLFRSDVPGWRAAREGGRRRPRPRLLHHPADEPSGERAPDGADDLGRLPQARQRPRSEEHTSELKSPCNLVCRLLLDKKKRYSIEKG